ncbi:hypothetical protein GCM10027068_09070 [Prescottella soli]
MPWSIPSLSVWNHQTPRFGIPPRETPELSKAALSVGSVITSGCAGIAAVRKIQSGSDTGA